MKIFIYTLSDKYGDIRYVGKTKNVKERYRGHIYYSDKTITYKNNWIQSLLKNGEYPVISVIDEVEYEDSSFFEKYWISQMRTWGFVLTNLTDGGQGTCGYKHTEEAKNKMRKPKSNEHKIKISNSQKGRKLNESWKISIKEGCKKSIKMLETNRRIGKEREIEVYQYDKFNLLINKFNSLKEAKEATGIKHISECINGKRKSSNGYIWSKNILKEKEFVLIDIKRHINNKKISINFKKIENIVCDYFNCSSDDIRINSTNQNLPKIYLIYLLYNLIDNVSFVEIDKYLGSVGSKFIIKYNYDNEILLNIGDKFYSK